MRRWLLAAAAFLLFAALPLSLAGAQPGDNTNDPGYWVDKFPHQPVFCYEGGHGSVTADGKAVVLDPWDPSWTEGDHYEALIVKGGSVDYGDGPGNVVYYHPEPGVAYAAPLNAGGQPADVSHWIVCKGTFPDGTTTTTTTTLPEETTTTTTTEPPPTTTEPPPPTTEPPPPTTEPPEPPTGSVDIEIWCEWENRDADTDAHEPIISFWTLEGDIAYDDYRFTYLVYDRDGTQIGHSEFGLSSPGRHDSWVSDSTVPVPKAGFTVELLKNDVLWKTIDDPDCAEPDPDDPPPPPPEDPPTTDPPPELPYTGFSTFQVALFGAGLLDAGSYLVLRSRRHRA